MLDVAVGVVKGEVNTVMMGDDVGADSGEEEDVGEGELETEEEGEHLLRESSESKTQILFSQFSVIQSVDDKQEAHSPWKHLLSESFDPSTHFAL